MEVKKATQARRNMKKSQQTSRNEKNYDPTSQTSRKELKVTKDRISHLPDELCLHILSFLTMKDVIGTSILSSRWRNLWRNVPRLSFVDCWDHVRVEPVTFIEKSIARYLGSKFRELRIMYKYKDADANLVDSWIDFAVRSNVEVMKLCFFDGPISFENWLYGPKYELPHFLFQCGSLTDLTICGHHFNLPPSMHLRSLRKLSLYHVSFSSAAIEHLTSNCPLLEDLMLLGCNKLNDLIIYDPNGRLRFLKIREYGDTDMQTGASIYAPNLILLVLEWCMPRDTYRILKLSAQADVRFIIDGMSQTYTSRLYNKFDGYKLAKILSCLRVKDLTLSTWCIQILMLWETGRRNEDPQVCINTTHVVLYTGLSKWELPGIFNILENSFTLKTLAINICNADDIRIPPHIKRWYNYNSVSFWESRECWNWCILLRKLKTITIHGFPRGSNDASELTKEFNSFMLVKHLLKNLKELERMTIFTTRKSIPGVDPRPISVILELLTRNLSIASPSAELCINS